MKRVGYIAGAVALAPTAFAAALPATAQAAPHHTTAQTRSLLRVADAKKVALYHSGARPGLTITPALSTCTATSEWNAGADPYSPYLLGDFYGWYNVLTGHKICLGTVKVVNYFLHNNCRDDYFSVYYDSPPRWYPKGTVKVCGTAGESISAQYQYRLKFPELSNGSILVEITSTYTNQAFYTVLNPG